MRRLRICLLLPLLLSTLNAQDKQPEKEAENNGIDELLGTGFAEMPEMPNSIRIDHDGTMEMDSEAGTILFIGQVNVKGDNGITLKANRALVNSKKKLLSSPEG